MKVHVVQQRKNNRSSFKLKKGFSFWNWNLVNKKNLVAILNIYVFI